MSMKDPEAKATKLKGLEVSGCRNQTNKRSPQQTDDIQWPTAEPK